jgi:hypothetical protein
MSPTPDLGLRIGSFRATLLAALVLSACHHRLASPKLPAGCEAFVVEGDRVLCGAALFAEAERFAPGRGGCSGVHAYRGLAVRYASGERAWLFRSKSMDPEHPESYRGPRSESEFKLGWIGDVQLSEDGRKVFFREPAIFFPDRYEYDIVSGALRQVEWTQPKQVSPAPCGAGPAVGSLPEPAR